MLDMSSAVRWRFSRRTGSWAAGLLILGLALWVRLTDLYVLPVFADEGLTHSTSAAVCRQHTQLSLLDVWQVLLERSAGAV